MNRNEALAGTFFFLATGCALLIAAWPQGLIDLPSSVNSVAAMLAAYLVAVAGFGIGWVKGFPRWSYPYGAYAFVFALYWMSVATPDVTILNHTFERNELWGWRAWVPLLTVVAVAIMVTRSAQPVIRSVRDIRRDWTRLSFAIYGLMPLFVGLCFDEVSNIYEFPFTLMATVILVCGAFAYMHSRQTPPRALSLLIGASVTMAIVAVGNGIYWHGRQETWMAIPSNGIQNAIDVGITGGVVLIVMFLPALLQFFPYRKGLTVG